MSKASVATSLWRDRPAIPTDTSLEEECDDIIVGGGLTGLVTALQLTRAGRRVTVLEARTVGAVTTGGTTGKVSLLQGTKLSRMLRRQSRAVVAAYLMANRQGQSWLVGFCDDHAVEYQVRDSVTYAGDTDRGLKRARSEHEAALSLGLEVDWVERFPVPFPHYGGVVLRDQVQVDAMAVLEALVQEVRAGGGRVVEGRRVVSVRTGEEAIVGLADGSTVRGATVVLATGTPFLDRGLHFARLVPQRSYLLAFEHPAPPELMMISSSLPTRSLRDAPGPGSSRLLVGGAGHVVGRTDSEADRLDGLRRWTAAQFPDAVETHAWSAQDYASEDGVPLVGALPFGRGQIRAATGFDKWGLTNGVAAALLLAADILGDRPPAWAGPLAHRWTGPRGGLEIARRNAGAALALTNGLLRGELQSLDRTDPTEGRVGRRALRPVGHAETEAGLSDIVAVCTHLGGVLKWNDAERSWDCPLHGSRFAPDGTVLEGPACRPLRPVKG